MRGKTFVSILSSLALLTSCANFKNADSSKLTTQDVLNTYSEIVYSNYDDTLKAAEVMRVSIGNFINNPTQQNLAIAKKAWKVGRESYGQTEAFRFYGGPIDDSDGPEGQLNAWPMDESYITSLIQDPNFEINRENLSEANERGGEENIATGWHAIEFLLWGSDSNPYGPGNRPVSDYISSAYADRNAEYLITATDLLIDDLQSLKQEWKDNESNYRSVFENGGDNSLRKIFISLGSLSKGELSSERLNVAVFSQDQEDEHSCFSDNTHRDAVTNALGVRNVWMGEYNRPDGSQVKGPSIHDLVMAKSPDLAKETTSQINRSLILADQIQNPFDQEILASVDSAGPKRILAVVNSLEDQADMLVSSASAIGIKNLTLVEP